MDKTKSIQKQLEALGVKIDNHCTDLYFPVTEETKKVVNSYIYKRNVTTFKSQIDGTLWFDIPFAFELENTITVKRSV